MKESGSLTRGMALATRGLAMGTHTRESTRKARSMGRESMYGIQVNTTRDNGRRASRTVTEFGAGDRATRT